MSGVIVQNIRMHQEVEESGESVLVDQRGV